MVDPAADLDVRVCDEDAENVTPPDPPGRGSLSFVTHRVTKRHRPPRTWSSVSRISEEDGRKGDVSGIFVTDLGARHTSSAPRIPGRLGHGHSLRGPWP